MHNTDLLSLGTRLSCTAEIYGTMSGSDCNVSYIIIIACARITVWETNRQHYEARA